VTGIANIVAAMGLGYEGIQAEQKSASEDRYGVVKALTKARRSYGHRTVGKTPDHNGVDYPHTHPADLGENQW
jgi:hypothetical protein